MKNVTITNVKNRRKILLSIVLILLTITGLYAQSPTLRNHYIVDTDVPMALPPVYRFYDKELFKNDIYTEYGFQFTPKGQFYLYVLLGYFIDPFIITKILPFFLCAISVIYVFKIGEIIANEYVGFFASALFSFHAWVIPSFSGGVYRAFCFPLLIIFLYYFIKKDYSKLIFIFLLQCLFHPFATMISLLTYAISFIKFNNNYFHIEKNIRKLKIFLISFIICILLLPAFYVFQQAKVLGYPLAINDIKNMPVWQKGGKFDDFFYPFSIWNIMKSKYYGIGPLNALFFLLFNSFLLIIIRRKMTLKFSIEICYFLIASLILFSLAYMFPLHFYCPDRYLKYSLPIFLILLISLNINILFQKIKLPKLKQMVILIILITIAIFYKPSLFDKYMFLYPEENEVELYNFLSTLDKDVVIAGHPGHMTTIPLFAKRKIFVSTKMLHSLHKKFYMEAERRTYEFFKAYYSETPEEVKKFCKNNKIDYLVVNKKDFLDEYLKRERIYFQPFDSYIRDLTKKNNFALLNVPQNKKIFEQGNIFVIKCDCN